MSEEATETTTTAATTKRKKRRKIWTEERRTDLLLELLNDHEYFEDLFTAFRAKQKYRGLTPDRVLREAKSIVKEAMPEGEDRVKEDFYLIKVPPKKPVEKPKKPTVAELRRALIVKHAKAAKLNARKKGAVLKKREEAAAEAAKSEDTGEENKET